MPKTALSCVLLADRHHGLAEGVRGLLATAFGSVIMVAEETSLIEGAGRLQLDMAIVDLSLARNSSRTTRRPATAPARRTSTSPASWPTWAMANTALPPELLEQELEQIKVLGIPIHTGARIDRLEDFRKNYDAVFVGPGTQTTRLVPTEGAHHPFLLGGIDFLRAVRSGETVRVGPRVAVVGGGNVAIDVALAALRQGAKSVDLESLEKRRDMPASPHEIEAATAEGVQLRGDWGPLRIEEEGVAVFQFCERVKDENGKFDPRFDAAQLLTREVDHVILATGRGTDLALLEGNGVEAVRGFITANPKTLMTNVPGILAGGDGQRGPRTAVVAIPGARDQPGGRATAGRSAGGACP